ncbi:MAG: hypothetical protein U0V70_09815 [Terriglobia bacterium]
MRQSFSRTLFFMLFFMLGMLQTASQAGTKVVQSWAAPGAGNYSFKHLLTLCVTKDQGNRQMVENQMAFEIKRGNPFQSYNVLTESDLMNKDQAREKIKKMGFDGAVVMRLLGAKDKVTYVAGFYPPYYGTFWGYYSWAWADVYSSDYVYTDKIFQVETTIYSITDDKLLWTSVTETTNPDSLPDLVEGVAKAIRKVMTKRGLIK